HRVVAWNKLAEICSQLLTKGRKVYVEGRLQTRSWTGQDNTQRQTTEIVITDMIVLDSRQAGAQPAGEDFDIPEEFVNEPPADAVAEGEKPKAKSEPKKEAKPKEEAPQEDEEIPF